MALAWPLTAEQVRTWLDYTDEPTDDSLDQAVEAVVAYVPTIPGLAGYWTAPELPALPEFEPSADVVLGAAMLAARWHARRGSTLGTVGYPEFGSAMIMRHDPDIGRMLRIGSLSGAFVFGAPSLPVEDVV